MSIGPPILEIQHFQNLTLKIKGQGHWWGHSSKSQCGSSILSTHIPFFPCQSALPFLRYSIFKIWPWKIKGQGHGWGHSLSHNEGLTSYRVTSLSFHVNRPSHSWDKTFFKIWPWKSRVKVKWPWCCTTTGLENSIDPSSGFKDMGSAKSGPSAAWFDKFLAHGQTHMGQMGK